MSDNNNNIYNFNDFLDFNKVPTLGHEKDSRTHTPPSDPIEDFRKSMADAGYTPPDEIITDGNIHRFQTDEDDHSEKSGWYAYFDDAEAPGGVFGDWRHDVKHTWSAHNQEEMTIAQRRRHEARQEQLKIQREQKQYEMHLEAARQVEYIWQQTIQPKTHPYLFNKNVKAYDIGQDKKGNLIIPLRDETGKLWSYESIDAGGQKLLKKTAKKKGNFHKIPGGGDKIFIAEGYSTAATIHEATGATTVVAVDAGNLKDVADKFSGSGQVIIAADNDHHRTYNKGVEKAKETEHKYIIPENLISQANQGKGTDFNDIFLEKGIEEVQRQINRQLYTANQRNLFEWAIYSAFLGPAPEREYLVDHTFPKKNVVLLAAQGDAGKGVLISDLALKVGTPEEQDDLLNPPKAFGAKVNKKGTAVVVSAEDDKDEIHRRIEGLKATKKEHVHFLPLPDAGGPAPLVVPGRNGPLISNFYWELKEQLLQMQPQLIVFDPLSSFAAIDVNSDPVAGTFVMELFQALASETGATVIVCHHLAKTSKAVRGHEDARNLIRGTTALVNSCRCAYVLWAAEENRAKKVCKTIGTDFEINKVFQGCVVKSNGPADRTIRTFVRNMDNGLLECRDSEIIESIQDDKEAKKGMLLLDIKDAAEDGFPYVQSGNTEESLYARRDQDLSVSLRSEGRDKLIGLAQELLNEGKIQKCRARNGGKKRQWLDVSDGPFAQGEGWLADGARLNRGDNDNTDEDSGEIEEPW